ncbi:hypothetical protein GCM10009087_17810 [Sphingomonas oligophenolica]
MPVTGARSQGEARSPQYATARQPSPPALPAVYEISTLTVNNSVEGDSRGDFAQYHLFTEGGPPIQHEPVEKP